jgi:hypothetical protein
MRALVAEWELASACQRIVDDASTSLRFSASAAAQSPSPTSRDGPATDGPPRSVRSRGRPWLRQGPPPRCPGGKDASAASLSLADRSKTGWTMDGRCPSSKSISA